jgi:hypothetical protein
MSVKLMQTETTFHVEYDGEEYSITILEDGVVGYTNYDVFDDQGQLVNEDLEEILIAYLEEHL